MNEEKEKQNQSLISLSEAARMAGCTPEHLNLMARRGKMKAQKLGRNWYTTEEWLGKFLAETEKSKNYKKGIIPVKKIEPAKIEREGKIFELVYPVRNSNKIFNPEEIISSSSLITAEQKEDISNGVKRDKRVKRVEREEIYIKEEVEGGGRGKKGEGVARGWRFSFSVLTLASIIILFFFAFPFFKYQMEKDEGMQKVYDSIDQISFFNPESGIVLGEETDNSIQNLGGAALASENFRVKQIRFGGFGGETSVLSDENIDLKIEDVRSETFMTKKQDEAKLVIYWKTNKLAVSEIEYSKINAGGSRKIKEVGYGFSHGIVIPGLDLGTAYVYRITTKDRWGNKVKTGNFSVYSGSKTVSVVELITKEFEKLFGWAKVHPVK